MSSGEEGLYDSEQAFGPARKRTRRRIQRSCDVCRRKKIKCDWAVTRDNKCTYCKTHHLECRHTHGVREEKLEPPTEEVEALQSLIKTMSLWIAERHPNVCLVEEFDMPSSLVQEVKELQRCLLIGTTPLKRLSGELSQINLMSDDQKKDEEDLNEEGDGGEYKLSELQSRFQSMTLIEHFLGKGSVIGKSSGLAMIQHALGLKQNPNALTISQNRNIPSRREDLWDSRQFLWLKSSHDQCIFDLPPGDLLQTLVDAFFESHNPVLLLFHEPSFRANMNRGLHFREPACAAIGLLICAIMSRYSDDPRALSNGSRYSPGYRWYLQAKDHYTPSKSAPDQHDVQMYALMTIYLDGSSSPQTAWTACGNAIRMAMDVGAHRKKAYHKTPTIEDEVWKRAFWTLVILDRQISAHLGRSCNVQDEDMDLELPLEVDDEYWDHPDPAQRFKQPPGKPCRVSFLIALIKLMKISGVATRTIFSANPRANILLEALGKGWEQKIVTALDSAMNEWASHVPDHLKWDPRPTDPVFLFQSGILHTQYYQLQIIIHRAYIPTPRKPPQTTFPSLAICTNAARTSCQIISYCRKNVPFFRSNRNVFQSPAFQPALVLIFSIWNARRNGYQIDISKDMEYIWECMDTLKAAEDRFVIAGKLWDMLSELVSMGDLPLSPATTPSELAYSAPPTTGDTFGHSLFRDTASMEPPLAYHAPSQMASSAYNSNLDGHLAHLHGSLSSADMTEMSPFAPTSITSSADPYAQALGSPGLSSATASSLAAEAAPPMDDLMAVFGFGSLVTDPVPQPEGASLQGVGDDILYTSLGMGMSDWDSWFPSLSQTGAQTMPPTDPTDAIQHQPGQHVSSAYNPLGDFF